MVSERPPRSLRSRLPLTRGRLHLFSPSVRGRAAEGGRGRSHTISKLFTRYRPFINTSAPHLKRNALHDSENERRKPVSVFLGVAHDLANCRPVVILDASSQRERQKVLRQSSSKQFGPAQERVFKSIDSSELPRAGQGCRRIDGLAVCIRLAPLSHRIEIL